MQRRMLSKLCGAALCAALFSAVLAACTPIEVQNITVVTPLPAANAARNDQAASAEVTPTPDPQAETTALPTVPPTVPPIATPTPLNVQMPSGSAAAMAMATDAVMKPELAEPLTFEERPVAITFDEFYAGFDMRKGLTLSDKLMSLDGVDVVMEGYMAPPLKPELDWFVLTRIRLEVCPFCSSGADWPLDIAVVYVNDGTVIATQAPVRIEGRMEIGTSVDPETGMVSLVRIYASDVENLRY